MAHRQIASWTQLTTLFLLSLATSVSAQDLPPGWHLPPSSRTSQSFRQRDSYRFLTAIGDFDGDGIADKALLLVNTASTKMGLFVCLKTATGCDWHRLEVMEIAFLDVMGIDTVRPGKQDTACGKGYWQCDKDEPKVLNLKHDAVEFFKDESASSVYVYDAKKRAFTPIATSD